MIRDYYGGYGGKDDVTIEQLANATVLYYKGNASATETAKSLLRIASIDEWKIAESIFLNQSVASNTAMTEKEWLSRLHGSDLDTIRANILGAIAFYVPFKMTGDVEFSNKFSRVGAVAGDAAIAAGTAVPRSQSDAAIAAGTASPASTIRVEDDFFVSRLGAVVGDTAIAARTASPASTEPTVAAGATMSLAGSREDPSAPAETSDVPHRDLQDLRKAWEDKSIVEGNEQAARDVSASIKQDLASLDHKLSPDTAFANQLPEISAAGETAVRARLADAALPTNELEDVILARIKELEMQLDDYAAWTEYKYLNEKLEHIEALGSEAEAVHLEAAAREDLAGPAEILYADVASKFRQRAARAGFSIPEDVEFHHLLPKDLFPELALDPRFLVLAPRGMKGEPMLHDLLHELSAGLDADKFRHVIPELEAIVKDTLGD